MRNDDSLPFKMVCPLNGCSDINLLAFYVAVDKLTS